MNSEQLPPTKLQAAFAFVCPAENAKRLAEAGLISHSAAEKCSWRDRIGELVLASDLEAAGLTIADVRAAVIHYTATEPKITEHRIKSNAVVTFIDAQPGYLVIADGYRAGPAGP